MDTTERGTTNRECKGDQGPDAVRQMDLHRGHVLAILLAALIGAELVKDVLFSVDRGEWLPVCEFIYFGMMACLPFLLAKWAPQAAGFEIQWLLHSRRIWAWFAAMVFLLFLLKGILVALAIAVTGDFFPKTVFGPVAPTGIVLRGITLVILAPIAEELFFRGYVLEQFRKLTPSGLAVLFQAVLFGLYHFYARALFTSYSYAVFMTIATFCSGLVLGVWRIKMKSFLPLILTHILLNATVILSLKAQYDYAAAKSSPIRHTVSAETTHITEPLRPDGSVDYVTALNRRHRQGVTTKNNAAVLFWKAVGPQEILPEYRAKYFGMLGIRPLREKGGYFVDFTTFVARRKNPARADTLVVAAETRDEAWSLLNQGLRRPYHDRKDDEDWDDLVVRLHPAGTDR